jgi:hypothetical protein
MTKHFRTKSSSLALHATTALFVLLWAGYCQAEAVTDWRTYKAAPATVLTGQGTNNPVIGSTATTAAASFTIGYLSTPAVLGPNEGDFVTFSFGVSFNDAEQNIQGVGDNFRFALFDLNGEAQDSATGGVDSGPNYATAGTANTDNFRGYWFGNKGGGGGGNNGSIRERIAMLAAGQNAFAATGDNNATAPSLGSVGGENVPLLSSFEGDGSGGNYVGAMTLTRNAGGLVDLSGFLKNAVTNVGNEFSASDTTANSSSTYGAVGFLLGGPLDIDQGIFTNVDVTIGSAPVGLTGDHNGDGIVDAADYVAWRKDPDANGGDPDGYDDWVANFGETNLGSGGGQSAAAVPEPALMPLAGIAGLVAFGLLRRRPSLARVKCC